MKIALMVEGPTEKALFEPLRLFLKPRLPGKMPQLEAHLYYGRVPQGDRLRRDVNRLLAKVDAVVALTDVYTGNSDFSDARDAKAKMREWVGREPRFHPHAAQHDFEAWLIPYWTEIQELSGSTRAKPAGNPELLNHNRPPAQRLSEVFHAGKKRSYSKTRDAARILRGKDLAIAAAECAELKALLNTLLSLCGGEPMR